VQVGRATANSDLFGRCVLRGRLPDRSGFNAGRASRPCAVVSFLPGPGDTVYAGVALYDSTPTGTIAGRVDDGALPQPIGGAMVLILDTEQGTGSDAGGNYSITGITPGQYLVAASSFGTFSRSRWVSVVPGKTTRVNWKLYPGSTW
jgi:hypothetical protein